VFRCKWSGNTRISEFDLVVVDHTPHTCTSFHTLLVHLAHDLNLSLERNRWIVTYIDNFFLELFVFFLFFLLFLDHFTYIGGTDYSYSNICISKSPYIVGAISSVDYSSMLFEVFDYYFLVMRTGPGEHIYEREIIMGEISC